MEGVFSRISRVRLDWVISLVNKKQIIAFCSASFPCPSTFLHFTVQLLSLRPICARTLQYRGLLSESLFEDKRDVNAAVVLFTVEFIYDKAILYIASKADHLVDGKQPRKIIVWLFVRAELVISLG